MSPYRTTPVCALLATIAFIGANALGAVDAGAAGAADGARDVRPQLPPGVIIEPRRKPDDSDSNSRDRREDEHPDAGPGCPANDRKLELMV